MIDLHQHSIFSDGSDSINDLIKNNVKSDIQIMALTDHDTIDGCKKVLNSSTNYNISFIPGIEFSTQDKGESIHILAFGFDVDDPIIERLLKESIELRKKRVYERVSILERDFKIYLTKEEMELINKSNNPNKVLLANILIKKGYADNISDAIKKYLYHKMPESKLSTEYVLRNLDKSTAISSYAHGLGGVGEKRVEKDVFEERLKRFVNYGLKALECYYSLYNKTEQRYLEESSNKYSLLRSGGSDYHGSVKTVKIGELSSDGTVPDTKNFTILKAIKNIYKI